MKRTLNILLICLVVQQARLIYLDTEVLLIGLDCILLVLFGTGLIVNNMIIPTIDDNGNVIKE